MSVIGLKLLSGEELIARFDEKNQDKSSGSITVEKVRMLQPVVVNQKGGEDQLVISMLPWILGNPDGEVAIATHTIVCVIKVAENTAQEYLRETSDLQIPTKKILMS
jgi:hypothetical protein